MLLLVFMVTAPMMSRGIDVSLPVADQPQIPQQEPHHGLAERRGAGVRGDQPVNILLLEDKIRRAHQRPADSVVYLRADEGLRYGQVIRVVDVVKRAVSSASASCTRCLKKSAPEEKRP